MVAAPGPAEAPARRAPRRAGRAEAFPGPPAAPTLGSPPVTSDPFTPGFERPEAARGPELLFAVRGTDVLGDERGGGPPRLPDPGELGPLVGARHFLGTLGARPCYGAPLAPGAEPPAGLRFAGARSLFLTLEANLIAALGQAIAVVEWDETHRFCGRCAAPTEPAPGERVRRCGRCDATFHPRVAPAVIVLVERGREALLARGPHFAPGVFSALAGFVETGETLEAAAAREIHEEAGVQIEGLRYFGSQPWPFGRSLMVGFRARYAGGDLRVDGHEIVEAGWFRADALPKLPSPLSIARRLIEAFVADAGGGLTETL
jgi:NAD+ diphosphatase